MSIKPYLCLRINYIWTYINIIKLIIFLSLALKAEIQQIKRNKFITCSSTCSLSWGLPFLFCILLAFLAISFRLLDLGVSPPTGPSVVLPPGVQSRWSPVHGPLDVPEVGLAALARPIAPPPMLPIHVDFIVETVVDLTRRRRNFRLLLWY